MYNFEALKQCHLLGYLRLLVTETFVKSPIL